MKFGLIGAGVVGTVLATGLTRVGYTCVGAHTRNPASYERFCKYVKAPSLSLSELVPQADLLFITTQDDNIGPVAKSLWTEGLYREGQTWIHCSGALSARILCSTEDGPVYCLSLHPLQSFAGVDAALKLLQGTHFAVEGDNLRLGEKIVRDLGGIPHLLNSGDKSLYHAGAVMASNYLVVLASQAVELFCLTGMNSQEALSSILSLMMGTLENLERFGVPEALTGPLARADVEVVRQHLDHMPEPMAGLYRLLGQGALELAAEKWANSGLVYPPEASRELRVLLSARSPHTMGAVPVVDSTDY